VITHEQQLAIYRQERAWTRRLIAALPESAFAWRPAPGAFSCGELVIHFVQAERFWRQLLAEAAAGRAWDPFHLEGDGTQRLVAFRPSNLRSAGRSGVPTTFAGCLTWWDGVEQETLATLAAFTSEELTGAVVDHPIGRLRHPIGVMVHYMVSHEVHHRGQLSAYAKMIGVEQPPLYVGD
jgi:uncharacterized damage-inducible protein DinB